MSDDFGGRVILVTGGARGQGAAEARILHASGATVLIGDILDELGQALAGELGGKAAYVRLDVTQPEDWARAIERADALGGLYGLINNAGVYTPATVAETDRALWDRHVNVNQLGVYLGIKEAARSSTSRRSRRYADRTTPLPIARPNGRSAACRDAPRASSPRAGSGSTASSPA
jgi:NAD(P)-dependent dehydrogenase (short-subunit alcohol dehydrogenase family)